jgi:phage terminase large subunit-like protein
MPKASPAPKEESKTPLRRMKNRMLSAENAMHLLEASERRGDRAKIRSTWELWAHDAQLPPEGDWRTWLFMGGRGAGKTRAGAEWVRGLVEQGEARRIALVGPTLHDVREVMIEGPSGILAVSPDGARPTYHVTRRRLEWPNGAVGFAFSAEDPDSLRGPQFDAAWCDEIGAWARDVGTWDTLMFGLRLGRRPRVSATTTPRARKLVKRLIDRVADGPGSPARVVMTRAATRENAANLAPGFVEEMTAAYAGSSLAPQELEGEFVADREGALWTRAMIEEARVAAGDVGELDRVVVAVDPPAGVGRDACGIVAAGVRGGVVYVLRDASVRGMRPLEWAGRIVALARQVGAGLIVAEGNQGGEMVRDVLHTAGAGQVARVRLEHASLGKRARAQPVSVAYEQAKVRHAGVLQELEDEMCAFGAEGDAGASPDRVDALVWAVCELLQPKKKPGVF